MTLGLGTNAVRHRIITATLNLTVWIVVRLKCGLQNSRNGGMKRRVDTSLLLQCAAEVAGARNAKERKKHESRRGMNQTPDKTSGLMRESFLVLRGHSYGGAAWHSYQL